jgi:hypothetical protein
MYLEISFAHISVNLKLFLKENLDLVTQRRDPHGQDKSRIDTKPFATKIIEAVSKMASGIDLSCGWLEAP